MLYRRGGRVSRTSAISLLLGGAIGIMHDNKWHYDAASGKWYLDGELYDELPI